MSLEQILMMAVLLNIRILQSDVFTICFYMPYTPGWRSLLICRVDMGDTIFLTFLSSFLFLCSEIHVAHFCFRAECNCSMFTLGKRYVIVLIVNERKGGIQGVFSSQKCVCDNRQYLILSLWYQLYVSRSPLARFNCVASRSP